MSLTLISNFYLLTSNFKRLKRCLLFSFNWLVLMCKKQKGKKATTCGLLHNSLTFLPFL